MSTSRITGYAAIDYAARTGATLRKYADPEDGAREGAAFVDAHIIRVTEKAFDDFADAGTDVAANRRMLGLE